MMKKDRSEALLDRAATVIPSLSQTFSKGPGQWVRGVGPAFLERGEGAWVWDVDGNRFLDHLMALGPIILGYNHPAVTEAVVRQLSEGSVFSQMHPLEVEVSELLVELIPGAEMVRFGKTGSDANTAAVRVARAFTGRDRLACCSYHGWHDWHIGTTTRRLGVPDAVAELTDVFVYNDIESLRRVFADHPGQIAGVVLEPAGMDGPAEGYLEELKALCESDGALLIFDEVASGFRFDLGGAQAVFGVTPDLSTFGKAMGNGLPISAVVGRRDVMEMFDDIFYSGTFGGETLSLAACKATIEVMRDEAVIPSIARYGAGLMAGLTDLIKQHGLNQALKPMGFPVRSALGFPHDEEYQSRLRRSFFMQECIKRGLLYFGFHLPCYAHGETELEFTLDVFREVMPVFAAAFQADDFEARMEGQVVEPIFRKT